MTTFQAQRESNIINLELRKGKSFQVAWSGEEGQREKVHFESTKDIEMKIKYIVWC